MELTLEEFQEINAKDLNCIFSESGSNNEAGFDYEQQCEYLLYNPDEYKYLIREKDKDVT